MIASPAPVRNAHKGAPVLSVSNLTTSFRVGTVWRPVVKNISFDIMPRETVAIVGESGSGKSVTSLSIMRLLSQNSSRIEGSVQFGGTDILKISERQMRNVRGRDIAMIYQEPMTSLNPVFTVGDQISEALLAHRPDMSRIKAKNEVIRLMERVRIPSAASRYNEYPHQFSGGMRQRIVIAMALASKPKLLIADEPTTALDVTIQGQVLDLIKSLQEEEQMSVLFITHDMGVVAEMADRTVVMYRGDIVETGETAQIFSDGKHRYTRSLLSSVPKLGSMVGFDRPMRFPVVDMQTGQQDMPEQTDNTVQAGDVPVLDVRNLTTRFDIRSGFLRRVVGRVHAVEDVSFSIQPGETLALVGESGCGKSTTGKSIMRLVDPLAGQVLVDGKDVLSLGRADLRNMRKGVQMIFQDPFASLNPRQRVGEAIAEPLLAHGVANAREAAKKTDDLLTKVGLSPDMASRFPHEFSGGQRQRVCIARALALDPKLIVADESVSALDVSVKAQVINLLLELQSSLNLAFLFISHDMAVVERVSHRVAVMYLGEIVEIGPREQIFSNPSHPYTRTLLDAVPVPDPSRRHLRRNTSTSELKSPIRPVGYVSEKRQYREISADHLVLV
jgi:peptide/nickel transport system ATP-binding protein